MADEFDYPKQVMAYYLQKGYAPIQAAAMAANSAHEGPASPTQTGDKGTAYGRFQWRGDRRQGLYTFAKARGLNPDADQTQWDYADWELRNTEKGPGQQLFSATTPEEANDAMMNFLRPGGQENGPRAVPSYNSRLQMAQQLQGLPQSMTAYAMAPSRTVSTPGQPAMQQADPNVDPLAAQGAVAAQAAVNSGGAMPAGQPVDRSKSPFSLGGSALNGLAMMAAAQPQQTTPQLIQSPIHKPQQFASLLQSIFGNSYS